MATLHSLTQQDLETIINDSLICILTTYRIRRQTREPQSAKKPPPSRVGNLKKDKVLVPWRPADSPPTRDGGHSRQSTSRAVSLTNHVFVADSGKSARHSGFCQNSRHTEVVIGAGSPHLWKVGSYSRCNRRGPVIGDVLAKESVNYCPSLCTCVFMSACLYNCLCLCVCASCIRACSLCVCVRACVDA